MTTHAPPAVEADARGGRYLATRRATLAGAALNAALAAGKLGGGVLGNSQALIADGVDSLSDLLTDGAILFGARQSARAPDAGHPYGHARAETLVTLLLAAILIGTAVGIGWRALARLVGGAPIEPPALWTLGVAVAAVVSKELFYQYLRRVARAVRSRLLEANAWHHRTDSISSVVVLGALAGSIAGWPALDAVAAVAVAALIAKVGWELGWEATAQLMDASLSADRVNRIRAIIQDVHGVRDLHFLRTRYAGADALVDVHIIVDPRISVSEGHRIAERIRDRVTGELDEVADVLVHVDSEDDRGAAMGRALPGREIVERDIRAVVAPVLGDAPCGLTLHYLRNRINAVLELPLDTAADPVGARALAARLKAAVGTLPHVAQVDVHFVV